MSGRTKEKVVTQTDIARELNTSVVSVSNALNGRKGVSDELRQKILDTAEEIGYQGSMQEAQEHEKTFRIGVLISRRYLFSTPSFYMKVYQEIVMAAAAKKCVTFLEVMDPQDEERLKIPDLVSDGQSDGILVVGELKRPYTQLIKEKSRVPVIFVDYYEDIPDTDFIISDGYTGTCRLTRMLLDAGYRRVGFVGNIMATSSIMDRYLGYRKAMMERDVEIRQEWIISDRDSNSCDLYVDLPGELPEAFVCNCDRIASILIGKLRKAGYRVPEDIGVVGFDHFLMERIDGIELTTYDVDIEAMARVSVNTLLRKMNHTYFIPRLRVISGKVVYGNSFCGADKRG